MKINYLEIIIPFNNYENNTTVMNPNNVFFVYLRVIISFGIFVQYKCIIFTYMYVPEVKDYMTFRSENTCFNDL